jgi:hypothetical protein
MKKPPAAFARRQGLDNKLEVVKFFYRRRPDARLNKKASEHPFSARRPTGASSSPFWGGSDAGVNEQGSTEGP